MLEKLFIPKDKIVSACTALITENNLLTNHLNSIQLQLTSNGIADIINKTIKPQTNFTNDDEAIGHLVNLFTVDRVNKSSNTIITAINNTEGLELRKELMRHLDHHQIAYGWGSKDILKKIQSPKALFAKNTLLVAVEFVATNTFVNLDITQFTKEKTFSIRNLDAEIELDTYLLMTLAALYTAYFFRNLYIQQETRRFKLASPEITGSREATKLAEIAKESNVFQHKQGLLHF